MAITRIEGRAKPWRVYFRDEAGKRIARHFATKDQARDFEKQHCRENQWDDLAVTPSERAVLAELRSACDGVGLSVEECIRIAIQHAKSSRITETPMEDALEQFLADCRRRNLRPLTIVYYDAHIRALINGRTGPVSALRREDVLEWLLVRHHSDSSRHMAKRAIMVWLRWCAEHGMTREKWEKAIRWRESKSDEKRITILTPKQMADIMKMAQPSIRVTLAIMAFAGVRPDEIVPSVGKEPLDWGDVDFEHRVIRIRGVTAKTREYRELSELPDNLWQWLETAPAVERKGKICGVNRRNFRAARKKAALAAGVEPWPRDVLRHSFASYGYHKLGMEHTLEMLGHAEDSKMFARHYKGVASPTLAAAWFRIVP